MARKNRTVVDTIYGLACADALALPVISFSKEELQQHKVESYEALGDPFFKAAGTWSNPTSLALCTMEATKDAVNYDEVMKQLKEYLIHNKYTCVGGNIYEDGRPLVLNPDPIMIEAIEKSETPGEDGFLPDVTTCGSIRYRDSTIFPAFMVLPVGMALQTYLVNVGGTKTGNSIIGYLTSITHAHRIEKVGCSIIVSINNALSQASNIIDALIDARAISEKYFKYNQDYWHIFKTHFISWMNCLECPDESFKDSYKTGINDYIIDDIKRAVYYLVNSQNYLDAVLACINDGNSHATVSLLGAFAGSYYGYDLKLVKQLQEKNTLKDACNDYIKGDLYRGKILF